MFKVLALAAFTAWLAVGSAEDIRTGSVPVRWIAAGFAIAGAGMLSGAAAGNAAGTASGRLAEGLCGALIALPFVGLSFADEKYLGKADGLVMMQIGMLSGPAAACMFALALAAAGVFGLVSERPRRKSLPFIPFLTAGWIGGLLWM